MSACTLDAIMQITDPVQRQQFIQEVCAGSYGFINFVGFYFNALHESGLAMILIIGLIIPFFFLQISVAADKYLAHGMNKLAHKFQLSPALGAVTIVSFANGAPDILSSLTNSGKDEGSSLAVATLLGAFAFSSSLVIANVRFQASGDVVLDRVPILKEFAFYALALGVICVFGFIGHVSYWFVGIFACIYVLYILVSIKMDFTPKFEDELSEEEEEEGGKAEAINTSEANEIARIGDPRWDVKDPEGKPMAQARASQRKSVMHKPFFRAFLDEVMDTEDGVLSGLLSAPLRAVCLMFVPYYHNPFVHTSLKVFVYQAAIFFIGYSFLGEVLTLLQTLILAGLIGTAVYLIDALNHAPSFVVYFQTFAAIFSSIGVIKIFTGLIVDCITFLAFFFNIDQIILSAVLLSAGNTIGDFFSNGALSAQGESLMAGIASFSGQTFNCLIGMGVSVLMLVRRGKTDFDIFGLREKQTNTFLIVLICYCLLTLVVHLVYNLGSNWVLGRRFASFLVGLYGCFLGAAIAFGILSASGGHK